MWKFLELESDRKFKHVIFHLKQNTFGRSAQRSTALMGGNYAAPPGTRRWAASPAEYRGRLKRETRFYGPIPRAGVSIYTRHREIKRRSHPQSTSRGRSGGGSASLCFILTPGFRFVMHSNERSSLLVSGKTWGEEGVKKKRGRGSASVAEIKLRLPFLFPRDTSGDFDPRRSSFSPRLNAAGKVNRVDERLPRLFHDTPSLLEIRFASEDVVLRRKKKSERIEWLRIIMGNNIIRIEHRNVEECN